MKGKRHTPEQIVLKLREAEALEAQGMSVPHIAKKLGISEWTFYRWRKRCGAVPQDEIKRLRALEGENARLKTPVTVVSLGVCRSGQRPPTVIAIARRPPT